MAKAFSWPRGKRIAVLVSVLLETWSEGKSPTYFTRTTPLKPGAVDLAGRQWAEFGGREGIWRLIRTLDACQMRASIFVNGLSAETYPDAVRQAVKSGHVVEGHGWAQDQYFMDFNPDQQREKIRRTLDVIAQIAGSRPKGWATPVYGWNEHTFDLLVEEGIRWYADALDISLPRRHRTASGALVALPWCDFVDNRVLRASPRDYHDVYVDTFDYLYAHEPTALLHLAAHAHFGGRPLITAQLNRLLRYFSSFSDVWLPTHRELVAWFAAEGGEEIPYAARFFA